VSSVRYEQGIYIPEDSILHSHHRENLKSYTKCITSCHRTNAIFGRTNQQNNEIIATWVLTSTQIFAYAVSHYLIRRSLSIDTSVGIVVTYFGDRCHYSSVTQRMIEDYHISVFVRLLSGRKAGPFAVICQQNDRPLKKECWGREPSKPIGKRTPRYPA
jgi:hypothetical protein